MRSEGSLAPSPHDDHVHRTCCAVDTQLNWGSGTMEQKPGLAKRASKFVAAFLLGAVTGILALSGVMAPRAYLAALGQSVSTRAPSSPAPKAPRVGLMTYTYVDGQVRRQWVCGCRFTWRWQHGGVDGAVRSYWAACN